MRTLANWDDSTTSELAKGLDLSVGHVRKYLRLLETDRLIERNAESSWTLTSVGRRRFEELLRFDRNLRLLAGGVSEGQVPPISQMLRRMG